MVALSAGLLASVLLLQPAAANFNWGAAKPFNNPTNNNNVCNDQQKGGFSWQGLQPGNFNNFGGFDFSGFDCQNSFSGRNGRRAILARNGFQQKVIEGKCTADTATSPKISCGTDKNFSIKEMQITVEFDTDIDFEYSMPDGSSCKQTQKCSAGGSTITNSQCGGARQVTFKRPQNGRDCNIGIHKVDFDCEGGAPPSPPPPPPSTTTQSTTVSTKSSSALSTTSSKTSTSSKQTSSATTTSQGFSKCTSCTRSSSSSTSNTAQTISTCTSCQSSSTSTTCNSTSAPTTSKTFTTLPPYTNSTVSQSIPSTTSTTDVPKTLTSTTSELPNTLTTTTSSAPSSTVPSITTAPETVPTTSEQVTTELTFVTLTTCDVTLTHTTNNITLTQTTQTLSTTTLTSTVTFCPNCGESVPTQPGQPPSPPSSTTSVTPPPPPATTTSVAPPPPPSSSSVAPPPPPATSSTTSAPSTLQTSTVQSSTSAVPPTPPPPPADTPQSPCPETLPRCMNTWLSLAKCASNSDAKCMCPNSEFTKNVISCVTAWGASDKEIQAALSYFAGICAEFVPQNPGICTDVPTSITLIPTITPTVPATSPPASSTSQIQPQGPKGNKPPQEVPCTTITLIQTITSTAGGPVQTTTQFITVPQVTFVTGTPAPAPPATAVDGGAAPPPAPAQPSIGLVPMPQPVQAGPTTPVPAGGAAAAPSSTTFAVGGAAPSVGGPIAAPSGTGSAQNPQVSVFTGDAVRNGAMLGGAGVLAVVAFFL